MTNQQRLERVGIAASPGIGIGPAYILERHQIQISHSHIEAHNVSSEQKRFRTALRVTQEQLEAIKGRLSHGEHRQILKAQQMMLRDPDLILQTEQLIKQESINAEWAVVRIMDDIRESLGKASDDYLRERQFDIAFLSDRLLKNLLGEHAGEISPPVGSVVVAHDLSPADMGQLSRIQIAGIVTGVGAATSHSAIMARALGIPAVVGLDKHDPVLQYAEPNDEVIVDGLRGVVIIRPEEEERSRFEAGGQRYRAFETAFSHELALPPVTQDGRHIFLRANLALNEELDSLSAYGAEGIGLYRTEYMYLGKEQAPSEEEHYRTAKTVLARSAPHPVVFRSFDLGGDKACRLFPRQEPEANPAMGLRSLRLALKHRDYFIAQLRGLYRAALHGPLKILLPLVSGREELFEAFDAIEQAKEQLEDEGLPHAEEVPLGIMVEVPSAAVTADLLAKHVDFMSIGTNDLIQYSLAIDRENDEVGYLYNPLHPAILRLIRHVCLAGKAAQVPVSLCGEMASDPRLTWLLIGMGIDELSVHPSSVPLIKNIIRASHTDDMAALADAVMEVEFADEALAMINAEMGKRFPEHMLHVEGLPESNMS